MLCLGVYLLLPSIAVVAGCGMLVVTDNVVVLLVTMEDISCRVIFSLSIDSSFVLVLHFSVIVFVCVVLSSAPLAVAIAL